MKKSQDIAGYVVEFCSATIKREQDRVDAFKAEYPDRPWLAFENCDDTFTAVARLYANRMVVDSLVKGMTLPEVRAKLLDEWTSLSKHGQACVKAITTVLYRKELVAVFADLHSTLAALEND